MYRYLRKLTFTRRETVSKWCHARKTRRCGGAFSLLLPLVFATVMLLHTPVVRAVDVFNIREADTSFCQMSITPSMDNFKLPGLGGSYAFLDSSFGSYLQGPAIGAARLTGVVHGSGGAAGNTFAVDIMLDDRLDPGDVGYTDACRNLRVYCGGADRWHVYTALTGTLTGLSGTYKDAVYNVTLSSDTGTCNVGTGTIPAFQVGKGANTRSMEWGAFAKIYFELDNPAAYPDESRPPVGPFSGELALEFVNLGGYPVPSPNLTGTWTGVVDCAGMLDFSDVETFSSPMTLKVGPQSGLNYSAELSDADGHVVAAYCVDYTIDPRGSQINKGRMINSDPGHATVLLKVREDSGIVTLKAREFFTVQDGGDIDDLPDGLDFCKWSFTRIDDANPGITTPCLFDDDGDGVINALDQCPATPAGETVDEAGYGKEGCSATQSLAF